MTERFNKFFDNLMINEGVYSDDPKDSGGKTIYGIASKYHPESYQFISNLFFEGKKELAKQAAKNFYYSKYYNPLYEEIKDEKLAFRLFDFGVNAGIRRAVKLLQEVIKKDGQEIIIDGIFGRVTLSLTNTFDFYCEYKKALKKYYESLNKPRFLTGWLNRLRRVFKNLS